MSPIKILAVIFAVAVLVKLAMIIIARRRWLGMVKILLANSASLMITYLVLAAIVGYYVLTRINIIDVAAVMLFTSLLIGLALAPYASILEKLSEEVINTGLRKSWLPFALWTLLALWVLYAALK